ncbi:MAG: hypothetical protein WBV11_07945 [Salegentibacter sp.]
MHKKTSFLIDCSEAADCCDKAQYDEAGNLERMKMLLHLLFCSRCRDYTMKNTRLTKLLRKAELQSCTEEEKRRWQEKIDSEVSKKQQH